MSAITTDTAVAPIANGATSGENAIANDGGGAPIASRWRDVLPIHPAADKIPQASDNERRGLAGDIARHGQKVPVVLVRVAGGNQQLLDGRHRLDFLEGAGTKVVGNDADVLVPHQIVDVADDAEAERLSLSLNAHRRHLPADERRKLLRAQLKATPEKSDRAIGAIVGMSHHTVAAERTKEEARGQIAHVESRTDTKGRKQPAKKPARKAAAIAKTATKTATKTAKTGAVADKPAVAGNDVDAEISAAKRKQEAIDAESSTETVREVVADEEIELLRKFARFVIDRATAIRFEPKDHAEYKVLRGRVEQAIGGGK